MRKAQKDQVEKIVGLLEQVHGGIKQQLETGRRVEALDLLGQCQSGASQLGKIIEQSEGEGFVTVTFLEEYCEVIYQIYEAVRKIESIPAQKVYTDLDMYLIRVRNSVKNDISVHKEVVFLPYKASMWDSLESVWKAADEDPNCDAYVIPIPYYNKNPDGTFREEHYEGDQYPDDVPITHYNDYDFASRRPDLIFIHNPYDNYNYVTSVHPFFYSENLKKYTDMLVYIPYFILGEVDPENKEAIERMSHFCTTPAVIHADRVIVQSENMRKIYIDVMTEYTKSAGINRTYWEKKILGLGSPKVDKVLCTSRENVKIPKEWLQIIRKPDGSWKKIILYNTGITGLLRHGEKMLVKMRNVFRVFQEQSENVALLWRPHPLIKATIESMRPELWEEYRGIVEEYRTQGWGIYDDTADMDRAIALCDGYYGDGSSLVSLCCKVRKPVMVQNVEVMVEKG